MPTHPYDWQILVVEDQDDSVQVVSQILEHYGIEVHVARNGQECLDMLPTIQPTLVITDLAMPEMDGWQMLNKLRSQPETADLIVVAITAYHSVNVAEDALAAGFDAYFAKPIAAASFVDELAELVGQLS
jgi:CheY-like chemotaxis protein